MSTQDLSTLSLHFMTDVGADLVFRWVLWLGIYHLTAMVANPGRDGNGHLEIDLKAVKEAGIKR